MEVGKKVVLTGKGCIVLESDSTTPIVVDFNDELLASKVFQFVLENCEDVTPDGTFYSEEVLNDK